MSESWWREEKEKDLGSLDHWIRGRVSESWWREEIEEEKAEYPSAWITGSLDRRERWFAAERKRERRGSLSAWILGSPDQRKSE